MAQQISPYTTIRTQKAPSPMKSAMILVLAMIVPMLDTTMTNIGINTILKDLNSTVNTMQWITTAYVLALGLAVPLAGWLIDKVSGKLLVEISLVIFLVGSIMSGISTSVSTLMIGRIIQGAAAGVLISASQTLIVRAAGGKNLGKMMATVGLPIVFAPIIGPTIGGALIKFLNWHWLFYVNIPVIFIALFFVIMWLPTFDTDKSDKGFDFTGFILLVGLFSGLVVGITNFSTDDVFGKMNVLFPIFIGIDCLILYIIYAYRNSKKVLVPLTLFKNTRFSASAILLFMTGLMSNGVMFVLPLYLQNIRGLSVIWSGIYLIALGLGMLVTRTIVGRLTDDYGAKWIVIISLIAGFLTTIPFAFFTKSTPTWLLVVVMFLLGLSRSGIIPIMTDSYSNVPNSLISEATVSTRMIQNIGGSVATALLAAVIASFTGTNVASTTMMNTAYSQAFIWISVGTLIGIIPAFWLSETHEKKVA
ncbi:DHA2 family efflux MFS transporter permease subunit [Companilactobacillus mishanensis]|uniref:DHA2 family efflux MFS transporter permease subunit n=1 Tax=Companilactobacillus mishanensis TaxID=2486008 RepID=UPI001EE99A8D|nr:DHA2 family efflux MFS transporter permease subunit [Companilactobacillus mishanensis]